MATYLDLDTWPRRPHFELFRAYESPFFNICATVDVSRLRSWVDNREAVSFFVASLYLSTRAARDVECFRYRLRADRVIVHDSLDVGTTVLLDDQTFGFAYIDFHAHFGRFHQSANGAIRRCVDERTLDPKDDRDDLIHYSVIPWISFTSFTHARRRGLEDSTPKIVFGRYSKDGDRLKMPVSVEVHHALVDGIHVGEYFSRLESYLSDPEKALEETFVE